MQTEVFQTNPKLRGLLIVLMFTFAAGGIVLAVLAQIQAYNREQIYLATEAALPRHRESSSAKASEDSPLLNNDIEGWKTYRNEEYGFEMMIPSNWVTTDYKGNQQIIFTTPEIKKANYENAENCTNGKGEPCNPEFNPSIITFYLASEKESQIEDAKEVKINNITWIRYPVMGLFASIDYYFQHNGKYYNVEVTDESEEGILKQILSTFKFIR